MVGMSAYPPLATLPPPMEELVVINFFLPRDSILVPMDYHLPSVKKLSMLW